MPLDSADITVVLNGHREGILIHRTLRSILRAVDYAREQGLHCEIVAVLDRPDRATAEYFARVGTPLLKVVEVDFGDPGLARNRGVAEAGGAYVALVDGDDLICRNWLADAFAFAEQQHRLGRRPALHPEANIFFGEDYRILKHIDQESPTWSLDGFFVANYWTALVFARKEDLLAVPYRAASLESGFGFEDWDWNCLSVSAGIVHKVIAGTWHFIRIKNRGSRNEQAKTHPLLVRPSPLFDMLEIECGNPLEGDAVARDEASLESIPLGVLEEILSNTELLSEWRDLAFIEPGLCPTLERLKQYSLCHPSRKGVGIAFGQVMTRWGPAPSHVVLCDEYGVGNAGLLAQAYVQALCDSGADVVVAGEFGTTRPARYGKGSVRFVDFSKIGMDLEPFWSARLLGQALVQRPPKTVYLIESRLGYEAISSYGVAITGVSRIFATVAGLGYSTGGQRTGLAAEYFDQIATHLAGLLSESIGILDWFSEVYGFPRDRCYQLHAVPLPSIDFTPASPRDLAERPKVLWMADEGQQSCPSMLIQIARLMPNCDFVMALYKYPMVAWFDALGDVLLAEPNIIRKSHVQWSNSAMTEANALLYTSLIDGLPAAFFEASLRGLPIVAPGLAAIREFVDEETGYPVEEFSRPEAYAERLRELLGRPEQMQRRVARAQQRVRKEYSWRAFVDTLQSIDGNRCAESARPAGLPRER